MSSIGWWCLGFILLVLMCKSKPKKKGIHRKRDSLEYATCDEIDDIMCRLDAIEEELGL
jgi:hypothetical protein